MHGPFKTVQARSLFFFAKILPHLLELYKNVHECTIVILLFFVLELAPSFNS